MKITFPKSSFKIIFVALSALFSHSMYSQQSPVDTTKISFQKIFSTQEYSISRKIIGNNYPIKSVNEKLETAAPKIQIDTTRISANGYIAQSYQKTFARRTGFALPPAIFGNTKICFPTPGTTTLTGTGTPAAINPWVSSNMAVATVSTSGVVTGVAFGTTSITYTDSLGNNAFVNVTVNPLPTISGLLTKCVGGTTQLTGTGSPDPASPWTSSNTAVATVSNTGLVTGVTGGTTVITYTNSNGCIATTTVTINPLLSPTITCGAATTTQVSFSWGSVTGASTYTIFYKINGGTSTFGGSGPVLTYTVTGVSPNDIVTLIVTPSGAVGTCFASGTVNCAAAACSLAMLPAPPTVAITQPTCAVSTGGITITAVAGLTYNLDGGAYSGTLVYSGIAPGPHTVSAKNIMGCSAITNITINPQPATPAAPVLTPIQPTCTVATGTVTITAVAGETYSFDTAPYAGTLIYSGLPASSSHTVTAKNAAGCISSVSNITLNAQPVSPTTPTVTVTQPTCTLATGSITITAVVGETYSFDLGSYSAILAYSGLIAGSSHTITSKNAVGCISPVSNITLNTQPATPAAPVLTATQPTCTLATGSITITGVAGETYSFDTAPYSATLAYPGLVAGSTHTVTAKNAAGCISLISSITLNTQPATPAAPVLTATQPTCTLATGSITITGVAGETYSFDTAPYSATLAYPGLVAGSTHTVTAKNAAGCISLVSSITLNTQPATPAAPVLTATQPTCTLATGSITITGVAGETYSFDTAPYSATLAYPGLVAGSTHTVTAKNAAGCISLVSSITLNTQPATPAAPVLTATQPTCTLATGSITITGVAGETYSFDTAPYSATLAYPGLVAGSTHTVTAKNAAGCISLVSSITLNTQPATPAAPVLTATQPTCTLATGTVTITGVAGETYSFDTAPYSATLAYPGLVAGSTHTVTAKNAAGCISLVSSITLNTQPATPAAPVLTATQPTCTLATGTVTITGVAGETYSFDTAPYSATLAYPGLVAGSTHTVTAKNAAGCISLISSITLNTQPATPAAPVLTATQPTCTLATGSITITGVAGETYSFDTAPYSATLAYPGLVAGSTHTVTAKNAAGCISLVSSITLNTQPATPAAPVLTATQPTCTLATGSITITGVAGETYSFDTAPYSATLAYPGLVAGSTHTVTAKNAAGCISLVSSITLNTQPATPAAPVLTATQPTCTLATGSITITGVAGETYSFDTAPYSATLAYPGLVAGSTHTVTAKNAAGCISLVSSITLNTQPATPAAPVLTATQPTCTLATGSITITGVAGETYSFDTAPYSATLAYPGLVAGSTHTVTAKNAAGCISLVSSITLNTQPATPAAPVLTATQPTCTLATGTVIITGVAGETYSFDTAPYSATLAYPGLVAGSTHTVTAKNAAGCISLISSITLNTQPATPAAPVLTATQPTCTLATGSITITGVAGETYSFDTAPYSATLAYPGLVAGSTHTVTAKNAAGCISLVSSITLNTQPATPAAPVLTATQPTCTLATGSITITGVAGETYSFDTAPYSATLAYPGLVAGSTHTVTAKNAAGCISLVSSITLNTQPATPAAPVLTATQPTCTLATGSITITGVAGETYSFDTAPYSATLAYPGLVAGSTHTVTAKNAAGCISLVSSITLNTQPATPAAPVLTATQPTCTLATGTVIITGVAGETYSFDTAPYSATLAYPGLVAGSTHTVTAKNAAGCISLISSITLNTQPATPAAPVLTATQPTCTLATGSITITGVAGETYSFDTAPYSATLAYPGLVAGSTHTVTAKNAAGCISLVSSITLNTQPATPAAPVLTATQPTCTLATGTVTITGVAGETYSFDTAPYSATLAYPGLVAGSTHTVTAKNAAGCISLVSSITLNTQPATPAAPVLTATQPTCTLATGSITITGVAGETYSFDTAPYSATLAYPGLVAGSTHTVTAKNAAGCISLISSITLNTQPATPAAPVLTATQPTCTLATGSITITGVAGETYSFDTAPYSATLAYPGLVAGSTHTVTAKNAAGCISLVSSITLNTQPATPAAPVLTATQPTCTLATGTVTITGVAGETYSFDTAPYSATLAYPGLVAGSTHTVTAKNAAGCISLVSSITLNTQPATPAAPVLTATQPTCTLATGSITITGVAGETYSFDTAPYSATLAYPGLVAGSTHTVTAKNAAGCISLVSSITLNTQPATPAAPVLTATQPTCTLATGSITITGVAGETYSFDTAPYSATLAYPGLVAGSTHTVTAKNAAGCISLVSSITLNTQPATPAAPVLTATQPTCTLATGSITITGVAGETYSFDTAPYSATLAYPGLVAGSTHTVTAKNAAGCISLVSSITLNTQPATPAAPVLTATQPTCTLATGTVTITGVAGETYSFDTAPYSATLAYPGLVAGSTHTVTAKNAAGCISLVSSITLNTQPATPAAPVLTATQPTCTLATGTVTITGVAGETYSFDTAPYSATLAYPGLVAGSTHTVTAKNAAGCISLISSITLNTQPATPAAPVLTATQPTCTLATGSITITGVAGETYSFDTAPYSATLAYPGLVAGSTHTVTAKNAAGCISLVSSITLNTQPATPAAPGLIPTQPGCSLATGFVRIVGVPGETYSFDSGTYSANLVYSGLPAGSSHTVTAMNAFGCISAISTVTINAQPATPPPPVLTITQPTCTIPFATVIVNPLPDTTYFFDGTTVGLSFNLSINAGETHTFYAINGAGCRSSIVTFTANAQPVTPGAPILTPIHPTCTTAAGTITITGTVGETYSFDAGPYSATLVYSGLAASSSHIVTAKNAAGCISAATSVTLNAQPATPNAPLLSGVQPTCKIATGSIIISGIAGELYRFDSGPFNTTLVYSGLAAGSSHTVIAKNSAGCTSAASTFLIDAQPQTPVATGVPTSLSICSGANATINLSSNLSATTFNWTVVQTNITGASDGTGSLIDQTLTLTGALSGSAIYTIVPNTNDCTGNAISIVITVYPLPQPMLVDGTICVDKSGATIKKYTLDSGLENGPYSYQWYFEGNLITGANLSTYNADTAGTYAIIATNTATGCSSTPVTAVVTQALPGETITAETAAAFSDNPIITVTVTPPNPAYQYILDYGPPQDSNIFTDVTPGIHTIQVIDVNGCTDLSSEVTVIDYPKFFTPNDDGYNDTWNIFGLGNEQHDAKIFIFDRHGKLLKQISPCGEGWDGNYNGHQAPATDYWFTVDYHEKTKIVNFKGHFSLKR